MQHPSAERARGALEAVSAGDLDALRRQLSDDIVWHVGGEHPLSGDYRGRDAVMGYHRRVAELTRGSLRLDPTDILASEHHLGVFLRASGRASDRVLDSTMVEAIRLAEDGRWAEFWALADDQPAVDAFWRELAA